MKKYFHPDFKFNGQDLYYADLIEVAYSLVKEGEPFIDLGETLLCPCRGCQGFVLMACSPCVAAERARSATAGSSRTDASLLHGWGSPR